MSDLAKINIQRDLANNPLRFQQLETAVQRGSDDWGVPADLMWGILALEGGYAKPHTRSFAGARGPAQMMPDTGHDYKLIKPEDFYDIDKSINAMAWHLSDLQDTFGDDRAKILAAYNGGKEGLLRRIKNHGEAFWWGSLPSETKAYITKAEEKLKTLASGTVKQLVQNSRTQQGPSKAYQRSQEREKIWSRAKTLPGDTSPILGPQATPQELAEPPSQIPEGAQASLEDFLSRTMAENVNQPTLPGLAGLGSGRPQEQPALEPGPEQVALGPRGQMSQGYGHGRPTPEGQVSVGPIVASWEEESLPPYQATERLDLQPQDVVASLPTDNRVSGEPPEQQPLLGLESLLRPEAVPESGAREPLPEYAMAMAGPQPATDTLPGYGLENITPDAMGPEPYPKWGGRVELPPTAPRRLPTDRKVTASLGRAPMLLGDTTRPALQTGPGRITGSQTQQHAPAQNILSKVLGKLMGLFKR